MQCLCSVYCSMCCSACYSACCSALFEQLQLLIRACEHAFVAVSCSMFQHAVGCCRVLQGFLHMQPRPNGASHVALQCIAVCCSVLQFIAVNRSVCYCVLPCVAVRCGALRCVAVRCIALQSVCSALQCVTVRCSAFQ